MLCSKTCMNLSPLMVSSHHKVSSITTQVLAVKHRADSSLGGSFPLKPISTEPGLREKPGHLGMLLINGIGFVLTCSCSRCVTHIIANFLSVQVSSKNPGSHRGDSKLYKSRSVFLESAGKHTNRLLELNHTISQWLTVMNAYIPPQYMDNSNGERAMKAVFRLVLHYLLTLCSDKNVRC